MTQAKTEARPADDREREEYEAPVATFVPLETEERLLACTKFTRSACGSGPYSGS